MEAYFASLKNVRVVLCTEEAAEAHHVQTLTRDPIVLSPDETPLSADEQNAGAQLSLANLIIAPRATRGSTNRKLASWNFHLGPTYMRINNKDYMIPKATMRADLGDFVDLPSGVGRSTN